MDTQLLIICLLTFVIHLIGTLAYAARIAGVRTRRVICPAPEGVRDHRTRAGLVAPVLRGQ